MDVAAHPLLEAIGAALRLSPRGRRTMRALLAELEVAPVPEPAPNHRDSQEPRSNDVATPKPAVRGRKPPSAEWLELREAVRGRIAAGLTTRGELAAAIGVGGRHGLDDWLTRRTPRPAMQEKIRGWLKSTAGNGANGLSSTRLTRDEQGRLSLALSTSSWRQLRELFGVADRDTLEAAAAGEALAAEIVGRLRGALYGTPQASAG
jgi:hypothetical protein